jgi:hypothetical protein
LEEKHLQRDGMALPFTNHNTEDCGLRQKAENRWFGLSEEEREKIIQVREKDKLAYLNNSARTKVAQNNKKGSKNNNNNSEDETNAENISKSSDEMDTSSSSNPSSEDRGNTSGREN